MKQAPPALPGGPTAPLKTLFKRRGLHKHDPVNNEQLEPTALQMCGSAATSAGVRERQGPALAHMDEMDVEQPCNGVVANADGAPSPVSP